MTRYFAYEELTWPEVAALPRDTPLVLPLGQGYALEQLASALGNPNTAGLLPSIPYGWPGSGLAVPEALLGPYLANLLDSLRDDGFSRVYALTPQGLDFGLGASRIALPHPSQLARPAGLPFLLAGEGRHPSSYFGYAQEKGVSPAQAARPQSNDTGYAQYPQDKVVLLPIGHTEQHGFHLPLSTDTLIIAAISAGTAALAPEQAISLPAFPYGVSTHRPSFAGTLDAGGRAFEDFWLGVVDALVARGFARFYLLSGHGGNCSFLVNVVKYAGERHRRIFCATAWLYLSGPAGIAALEKHRRSKRGGMGHAGELETALILHLRPGLTHMDRVVDETDFVATPSYSMDWAEGGTLVANPPWDDDTATGAYGAGSLATAENGARWLQAAIEEKAAHVAEIHEQHRRREAKREAGFGLWRVVPAGRGSGAGSG